VYNAGLEYTCHNLIYYSVCRSSPQYTSIFYYSLPATNCAPSLPVSTQQMLFICQPIRILSEAQILRAFEYSYKALQQLPCTMTPKSDMYSQIFSCIALPLLLFHCIYKFISAKRTYCMYTMFLARRRLAADDFSSITSQI